MTVSLRCGCAFFLEKLAIIKCRLSLPESVARHKDNRNLYKNIIENTGGAVELVYMKASKELLWNRLQKRNLSLHANSPFIITDEILEHHYNEFQEPKDEGETVLTPDI